MMFTAVGYGKWRACIKRSSAFTYVAQRFIPPRVHHRMEHGDGLHRESADLHDLVRGQAHEFAPGLPIWAWKIVFAVVFHATEPAGIKTSARLNAGLARRWAS